MNNFLKFQVIKNEKKPAIKGWQFSTATTINTAKFNVGIITGTTNNLLVVDIDVKDNGLYEYTNDYLKNFDEPQTVTQSTPNGGLHLLFLRTNHSKPSCQFNIDMYLNTRTKLRNIGIDIRSDGGYICAEPSTIDDKRYIFTKSFDKYPVLEMPETLINWLIFGQTKKVTTSNIQQIIKQNITTHIDNFIIQDNELNYILSELPITYLNNFDNWLKVLTVFKNLNKWDLFDKWSSKSKNYDKNKNISLWNNNEGIIDINYLVFVINETSTKKLEYFSSYKPYHPIISDISNITQLNMHSKYIFDKNYEGEQLTSEIFDRYDTIIIKSTTGTGKTTAIAEHCCNLKNNELIISIIDRVALANQQKDTFKQKGIQLLSYQDDNKEKQVNIHTDNVTICINSLLKYQYMTIEQIKNVILYIDEVSSLLDSLTHSKLLDGRLKPLMLLLMKLIKNSKKVIVSDALISDNVFTLLKYRTNSSKIFITNSFIKFKDVPAIRIKDEYIFIQQLLNNLDDNKPFVACSDNKKEINKLYWHCYNLATVKQQENFILIDSDNPMKIENATIEFKDKFVFYSPSISHGVDFQPVEAQDVFFYLKGTSTEPSSFFQQITRTRKISNLYYYHCESNLLQHPAKFDNIEACENYYKDVDSLTNPKITDMCTYINEDDDAKLIENTFFKLFTYNEYVSDIYNSNKLLHFENILDNNGFKLNSMGNSKWLCKKDNESMKEEIIKQKDIIFEEYLESDLNDRKIKKFDMINQHLDAFKLYDITNEDILKIKKCILDKYYFLDVLTFNKLIKNDETLIAQKNKYNAVNYNFKTFNNIYNKINLLSTICKNNNIKIFSFDHTSNNINISNKEFEIYKLIFSSPKAKKPTNSQTFIKFLVNTYKLLMPTFEFIKKSVYKPRNKEGIQVREYSYSIDTTVIKRLNKILNVYGFIKTETLSINLGSDIKIKYIERVMIQHDVTIDDIEEEAEIFISALDNGINLSNTIKTNKTNTLSYHEFKLGCSLFKYSMHDNKINCVHCNKTILDVYEHCMSCDNFIISY